METAYVGVIVNRAAIASVISLLEQSIASHENFTCKQLLTVLYATQAGGMTQQELASKLGVNASTITRTLTVLGPDGTGCLLKKGDMVLPDPHVLEALEELFGNF